MKVFNVETKDLEKVLDKTTFAMKSHLLTMSDMAESFKFVAPVAADMGIELDDLTSVIGALADVEKQMKTSQYKRRTTMLKNKR